MTDARNEATQRNRGLIARNALWYLAAGLGSHAYVFISLPLLQRTLSASDFGIYVVLAQFAMILQMAMTALFGTAILRLRVELTENEQRSFISTMLLSALGIQAVVWLALAFQGNAILNGIYPNLPANLGNVPILLGAWSVLMTLRSLATTLIKSLERPKSALVLNVVFGVALLLVFWIFLIVIPARTGTPASVENAFQALLCAEIIAVAAVAIVLRSHVSPAPKATHLLAALRLTGPLVLSSLVFAVILNLDGMILARYVDLCTLGQYGFGAVLGKASAAVVTAFVASYSARLINSLGTQPREMIAEMLHSIMRDNLAIVGLFTCALFVVAEPIIDIMMAGRSNEEFGASGTGLAAWVLVAISIGNLARSVFLVFSNTLFAEKRTWTILTLNGLLFLLVGGAMVAGAEAAGAAGVALGLALGYLLLTFVAAGTARRTYMWEFPTWLALQTLVAVAAGLAGTLIIWRLGWAYGDMAFWVVKGLQILLCLIWLPNLLALRRAAFTPSNNPAGSP